MSSNSHRLNLLLPKSSLGTTGQGLVQLTTNNVAQTAVGLGLETTDNVTFASVTSSLIASPTNIVLNADLDNNSNGQFDNIIFQTKGVCL